MDSLCEFLYQMGVSVPFFKLLFFYHISTRVSLRRSSCVLPVLPPVGTMLPSVGTMPE